MNYLLAWVSAALWIVVLGCSFAPLWWRRDWRFLVVPALLGVMVVAHIVKLETVKSLPNAPVDSSGFLIGVLAALAVGGYTVCLSRLARDQKRSEAFALSEQRARKEADAEKEVAAAVLNRVNDSFFSLDRDWRFTFVSKEACRILQGKPESFLGKTVWECFPGSVNSAFDKAYRTAMETQKPVFLEEIYRPWDRWFENRIYPSPEGVSVFFHDITERKQTESDLQSAKIQLDVAVAASNIGLWDWDIARSTVKFSPEWKAQLGYKPEEIPDEFSEWETRIHPDDRPTVKARLDEYLQNPSSGYSVVARLRHRDGSYRWILTRAELERDAAGKPSRMRGCHIDITDQKRAEAELRESQRELRALAAHLESVREEESARIARELHDELGQALTALKLDLKWLAERIPALEETPKPLAARLDQAISLTDDTINRIRRICLELRPALLDQLGLPTAIEWQVRDFETRTGIPAQVAVTHELSTLDPRVSTALFRISQEALTNVARHANATRLDVSLAKNEDRAELCIRDNGQGIKGPLNGANRGFGMLGMRERAMAIGGKFEVFSSPGMGVEICVTVPLQPKPPSELSGERSGQVATELPLKPAKVYTS